jgi:4a-hydroxytetrahydrobiopterin dehydratase
LVLFGGAKRTKKNPQYEELNFINLSFPMDYPIKRKHESNSLIRVFLFENFVKAMEFVNKIAVLAEKAQHHPDIHIFAYKNVKITLSTHDAGNTVTQKDIDLAEKIDKL